MSRLRHCRIEIDNTMIIPEVIQNGLVTMSGAKATFWIWSPEDLKFDQVDRFEKVTKRESDDGMVIEGESVYLRDLGFGPKAARATATVVKPRGCASCG